MSGTERYILLQQFKNQANPAMHERTTGPQIWNDTDDDIDVFVAGVGRGGAITEISRYIKKTQGKAIVSVAVEPSASAVLSQKLTDMPLMLGLHRIQGIGADFIPDNLDLSLLDKIEQVSNEEALRYTRRLAQEEGILAGISYGAAVGQQLAKQIVGKVREKILWLFCRILVNVTLAAYFLKTCLMSMD